jgi:hypothetical protein
MSRKECRDIYGLINKTAALRPLTTPTPIASAAVSNMPTSGVADELRLRFSSRQQRRIDMDTRTSRIRALNDELRHTFTAGMAVITPGIAALGREAGPVRVLDR